MPRVTHIGHLWNQEQGAVRYWAHKLGRGDADAKKRGVRFFREKIMTYAAALNDHDIQMAVFEMVDEIYKTANSPAILSQDERRGITQYLSVSAAVFAAVVSQRGFAIHYVVNNTFKRDLDNLEGPLFIFPDWFKAAGFNYICPQLIGWQLIVDCEGNDETFLLAWPECEKDSRERAGVNVELCHEKHQHYVYLDTEGNDSSFDVAMKAAQFPGVVQVFREEPPVPGSKCVVELADEPLLRDK